jgi:cysteine desulfurase
LKRIYLDYNASTPIAPEVADAMKPFLMDYYGNPSTQHWAGRPAKEAVEEAREHVARLLGCKPVEVVFTSGGSESNNHALKGVFYALRDKGNHIITTRIEHPAVLNPCAFLEKQGARVTYVDVDQYGQVSSSDIERSITENTILISVMHANNEVGTIQPIQEISKIAQKHRILFHTDAAQSAGKVSINVQELGVDLLTLAGHKMYAPKGIGVLYIRQGTPMEPFIHGAGHEGGRRAGTENVILIAGLGKACELALTVSQGDMVKLRDYLWQQLKQRFADRVVLNGHPIERLPNTVNVSFIGKAGADIVECMPELAVSTGSACHAGIVELSPVLKAMAVQEEAGMGTIRFSIGRYTTKEEIDTVVKWLGTRV